MSPVIKKKRNKFTLPSKYLLLILSGVCVALMLVTFKTAYKSVAYAIEGMGK